MSGWTFANPSMLWFTALAAVPLAVHLFHRRRARPHPFAAIDFVLRSRRRTARRLRLKRVLLFLVRTLLFVALPLALARPTPKTSDVALAPSGPAATTIVLDTSLSMSYRLDGEPLLDRARRMARDALARLSVEDPVTLVTCDPGAPPPAAPGFDRSRVREDIDGSPQTFVPQDLTACLGRATRALAESPAAAKRILLATDLTAAAFRLDVPAPTVRTPAGEVRPDVILLDAAHGARELPNAAIVGLRVEPAIAIGHRAFQFTVTVANFSGEPLKDLKCVLKVGPDVVAKGFLDVPARGTAVKSLAHRFPAGGVFAGAVAIAGDLLEADDARAFALRVPRDVRALVVDGAPNPVRFLDEAFFVETALTAPASPVRAVVRDAETAASERYADWDLVMLLNARAPTPDKARELADFVQRGGGLFVSVGDQVDPDAYNETLGALLPRRLHLVKTAAAPRGEGDREPAKFDQVAFDHPAFSVFSGEAREGMLSARTWKYFLLAPGDASQVTPLAVYDDGAPALLEARKGRGRIILDTSTVDRDWSDWAIRTSFLPAIQRIAGWLAGALDDRALEQALVGEAKPLDVPPGLEPLKAVGPDGKELAIAPGSDGRPTAAPARLPGAYRVTGRRGGVPAELGELAWAVHVDPRESDLTRLAEPELKAYFGEKTRTERGSGPGDAPPPVPAWSVLLALAAGLFVSEGLLLRK